MNVAGKRKKLLKGRSSCSLPFIGVEQGKKKGKEEQEKG